MLPSCVNSSPSRRPPARAQPLVGGPTRRLLCRCSVLRQGCCPRRVPRARLERGSGSSITTTPAGADLGGLGSSRSAALVGTLIRSRLVPRHPAKKKDTSKVYRKAAPALVDPPLKPALHAISRARLQQLLHPTPPARRAGGAAAQKLGTRVPSRGEEGPIHGGSASEKRRDHATSTVIRDNAPAAGACHFCSVSKTGLPRTGAHPYHDMGGPV